MWGLVKNFVEFTYLKVWKNFFKLFFFPYRRFNVPTSVWMSPSQPLECLET